MTSYGVQLLAMLLNELWLLLLLLIKLTLFSSDTHFWQNLITYSQWILHYQHPNPIYISLRCCTVKKYC